LNIYIQKLYEVNVKFIHLKSCSHLQDSGTSIYVFSRASQMIHLCTKALWVRENFYRAISQMLKQHHKTHSIAFKSREAGKAYWTYIQVVLWIMNVQECPNFQAHRRAHIERSTITPLPLKKTWYICTIPCKHCGGRINGIQLSMVFQIPLWHQKGLKIKHDETSFCSLVTAGGVFPRIHVRFITFYQPCGLTWNGNQLGFLEVIGLW